MPRKSKGARLYFRGKTNTYVIRDGQKEVATGCGLDAVEEAEAKLAEYIASKWEPKGKRDDSVDCTSVIMTYVHHKLPEKNTDHRRNELISQGERLISFFGEMQLRDIVGAKCREFTKQSSTQSMARHDLEIFRAATNHYKREYGLPSVPDFVLPPKGKPRPDYMTRQMAAKLVWAAYKRPQGKSRHLLRFILLSLHTGSRSAVVFGLQWFPNTTGGYVDLERNLIYRAPGGEGMDGNKRKPPMRIPNKLRPWLVRWREEDTANGATIRNLVSYKGKPISTVKDAFRKARNFAGLPDWVIPHIMRHTAVTWDMQSGKRIEVVAQKYGMTVRELERTYWHHSPDYQQEKSG